MEIRRLGPGDEAAVLAAASLFDTSPELSATKRFLTDPNHHMLFAFSGGRAVGFVSGVELTHPDKGTEMFLYELAVDADHRQAGIGTALVVALRDLAKERSCYDMWVLTDDENEAALRTYRKAGSSQASSHALLTWSLET
ncbi:MAG: GNAT family N-acetyltransferase [Candidatus Dormibacteraceae bacterium]